MCGSFTGVAGDQAHEFNYEFDSIMLKARARACRGFVVVLMTDDRATARRSRNAMRYTSVVPLCDGMMYVACVFMHMCARTIHARDSHSVLSSERGASS